MQDLDKVRAALLVKPEAEETFPFDLRQPGRIREKQGSAGWSQVRL